MKFHELPIGAIFIWCDHMYMKIPDVKEGKGNCLEMSKEGAVKGVIFFLVNTTIETHFTNLQALLAELV